jgi:hypothetical protein
MKRFILSCFVLIIASLNNGILADSIPENIDTINFNGKPKKKFTISVFTGFFGEGLQLLAPYRSKYHIYKAMFDPLSIEIVWHLSKKNHLGMRAGLSYFPKVGGSLADTVYHYFDTSFVPPRRIITYEKKYAPAISIPFDISYIYGRKHCISANIGALYSSGWLWDDDINSSQKGIQYGTRNYLKSLFLTGGLYYYKNKRKHFYLKTGIMFYYRIHEFDKDQLGNKGAAPLGGGKTSPSYADRHLLATRFFYLPKFHIGYKF